MRPTPPAPGPGNLPAMDAGCDASKTEIIDAACARSAYPGATKRANKRSTRTWIQTSVYKSNISRASQEKHTALFMRHPARLQQLTAAAAHRTMCLHTSRGKPELPLFGRTEARRSAISTAQYNAVKRTCGHYHFLPL